MKTNLILCPVDFSKCSELAADVACKLAVHGESKVFLLHVVETKDPTDEAVTVIGAQTRKAKERLRDWCFVKNSVDVQHVTLRGKPADVIVRFVRRMKIDVVIMGTHGRSGPARMVAGSVAQEVMRRAALPGDFGQAAVGKRRAVNRHRVTLLIVSAADHRRDLRHGPLLGLEPPFQSARAAGR